MNFRVTSFLSSRSQSAYSYTLNNLFSSINSASDRSVPNFSSSGQTLYKKISAITGTSVVPILDNWTQEGNDVGRGDLQYIVRQLNFFKRYSHALEVSRWMTDKRLFTPSAEDLRLRIRFIYNVHGLKAAEKYFDIIPRQYKTHLAYNVLLSCYCNSNSVGKAERLMQEIRDLGWESTVCYVALMRLYYQLGDYEKLDLLVQEMEQKKIAPDKFVYTIQVSAYADASDSDGVDKIVKKMEANSPTLVDTTVYSTIARAYVKLRLHKKALEILRKFEKVLLTTQSELKSSQYDSLIELCGEMGKKDEVLRIWNLYKKEHKIYNSSYVSTVKALMKLREIEEVVKIVKEWELNAVKYDFKVANFLIMVYCESGEIKKAEDVLKDGIAKGGRSTTTTWLMLARLYLKDNQFDKMVKALENANSICNWKDKKDMIVNCLKIFGEEGDTKRAENEDLIELLKLEGFNFSKVGDKVRQTVKMN